MVGQIGLFDIDKRLKDLSAISRGFPHDLCFA